jgi:predicted nucleic acid-binding protein
VITLVDSNVLLDVLTDDEEWGERSGAAVARAADVGRLAINPIIYAEVSVAFLTVEDLDASLSPDVFERLPLPWQAAFLAGKCFVRYRRGGGQRRSPLPDFYIGAHAAIEGFTLLTRDARRYRTYLPKLALVTP